jgi:hypothetical protein
MSIFVAAGQHGPGGPIGGNVALRRGTSRKRPFGAATCARRSSGPTTKQTKNMLVKRDKELHGPDRIYLTASSIVFVEPVGTDSKVAQLITEASKQ